MVIKKMRKYFPYVPFVGVIFMSQFPAGLSLNWTAIAAYNYIITAVLNHKKFNEFLGIPEYYPNTHLEKISSPSTKTFMIDDNILS